MSNKIINRFKRPVRFSKPDRSEKIGKAKRISPPAKQVVFQGKIKLNRNLGYA